MIEKISDCENQLGNGAVHRIALPDGTTPPPKHRFDIRVICVNCKRHFTLIEDVDDEVGRLKEIEDAVAS